MKLDCKRCTDEALLIYGSVTEWDLLFENSIEPRSLRRFSSVKGSMSTFYKMPATQKNLKNYFISDEKSNLLTLVRKEIS